MYKSRPHCSIKQKIFCPSIFILNFVIIYDMTTILLNTTLFFSMSLLMWLECFISMQWLLLTTIYIHIKQKKWIYLTTVMLFKKILSLLFNTLLSMSENQFNLENKITSHPWFSKVKPRAPRRHCCCSRSWFWCHTSCTCGCARFVLDQTSSTLPWTLWWFELFCKRLLKYRKLLLQLIVSQQITVH